MAGDFKVAEGSLREAIAESNRARGCVRDILRCRQEGILEGSAAIPLIRRFYLEDRTIFADRVSAQLTGLRLPIATGRPRILIMGVLRGDATLHRIVEEAGGYVVAEDDWRSSRAAGDRDVCTEMDPVAAIFEKYFHDEVSPRIQSADGRDSWFQQEIGRNRIDGVLFHVPLEDDVAGWDQPRQARWLEGQAVPSLLVRKTDDSAIAAFIRRLLRR
jgi:benzoyl-CoA reductase/2-hydroxyglutaryl-CoA dehydratase subunit BcrC/BadD/HgdB